MSMQVNTRVVEALMRLRGFTRKALAQVAGVRLENLNAWLDANDGSDLYISRHNQGEILHALGVSGDTLRTDYVHHWKIHESYLSREAYQDLQIMLHAFGEALAVVFQREYQPALSFSRRQLFGLRFAEACVVLEVQAPYLKSIYFDPENFDGLRWAFDEFIALLEAPELERLVSADITPAEFDDMATGKVDAHKWDKLHLIAREYNISPDEVEDWMVSKAKAAEQTNALSQKEAVSFKKVANGHDVPTAKEADVGEKPRAANPGLKKKAPVTRMEEYRLYQESSSDQR